MYLAASNETIGSVLVAEREGGQMLIYFVSKALHDADLRYPPIEKLAFALYFSTKKSQRYFQAHPIEATNPFGYCPGEDIITYKPRHSVKGQVMADILAKIDYHTDNPPVITSTGTQPTQAWQDPESWKLYMDRASSEGGSGEGLVFIIPDKNKYTYAIRFNFSASNNEAEYKAMLVGLKLVKTMR
ncbi:reverse transcriptase domain-containing protein [Tanacetum coccineum]